jgi:uncharacterized cupredoxin-like copper-binding protein
VRSIVRHALAGSLLVVLSMGCAAATPSDAPSTAINLPSASASPASASATAPGPGVVIASTETASAPPEAIAVQAGEGPIFRPNVLETPTGEFQIFLTSPPVDPDVPRATDGHNLAIRAPGTLDVIASSDYLRGGDTPLLLTVSGLEPGTYQFICEFRGHVDGGMYGTLTVAGG